MVSDRKYKSKELLNEFYVKRGFSTREIAEMFGCAYYTILYWMKKYDIPRRRREDVFNFKNRKHSDETKRRISASLKGHVVSAETARRISEATKGRIPWMKGRSHTEESKRKISEKRKGKGHPHTAESRRKISEANMGHSVSEETRRKIGDGNRGKVRSAETLLKMSLANRGRVPWIKGRKHTAETGRKISEAIRGEKHYNWKDGSSFEPYSTEFNAFLRRQIRERDGYTCRYCGGFGNCVHHIDYDKTNNHPSNLTTLCASCHGLTTNNNRDLWTCLFNSQRVLGVIPQSPLVMIGEILELC